MNGVITFLGKNDVIMVTLFGQFRGFSDMADCFLGGEDCCVNNATYRTMRDTRDDGTPGYASLLMRYLYLIFSLIYFHGDPYPKKRNMA